MGPAGRLQVLFGSQRRLSLGRESWAQCRPGRVRFVHRAVQLLQLRQLDLPAVLCVIEHALVLQRTAGAVVPHSDSENRAPGSSTAGNPTPSSTVIPALEDRSSGSRTTPSSWSSTPTVSGRTISPAAAVSLTMAATPTLRSARPTPTPPPSTTLTSHAFTRTTASSGNTTMPKAAGARASRRWRPR